MDDGVVVGHGGRVDGLVENPRVGAERGQLCAREDRDLRFRKFADVGRGQPGQLCRGDTPDLRGGQSRDGRSIQGREARGNQRADPGGRERGELRIGQFATGAAAGVDLSREPESLERLKSIGFVPVANSPEEHLAQIKRDMDIMARAIKAAAIKPE